MTRLEQPRVGFLAVTVAQGGGLDMGLQHGNCGRAWAHCPDTRCLPRQAPRQLLAPSAVAWPITAPSPSTPCCRRGLAHTRCFGKGGAWGGSQMQLNCSCPMNLPQDKPRAKAWCSSCAVVPLEEAGCWTCAKGKRGEKRAGFVPHYPSTT